MRPLLSLRPFYAFVVSHCIATYIMLAVVSALVPPSSPRPRLDGQDLCVLALSPLLSWFILLESLMLVTRHPWHALYAFGSYIPTFMFTLYLVLRRKLPPRGSDAAV